MSTTMDSMFETTSQAWQRKEQEEGRWRHLPLLLAGVAVVLALAGVIGFHAGNAPVGPLTIEKQTLLARLQTMKTGNTQTVALLQHRIHVLAAANTVCNPDSGAITDVRRLLVQGKDTGAAEVASLALEPTHSRICTETMLTLGSLWVTASTNALYGTVPASPLDLRPVAAWQGIERQAASYGVSVDPQLSPVNCLAMSFNARIWTLTRFCFAEALHQQLVGPYDTQQLEKAYAATRNEGHDLAFHFGGSARRVGLKLLATAAVLGRKLNRDEAAADLRGLLGPVRATHIAPDQNDVVLVALRQAR